MVEFKKIIPASCLRGSALVLPPGFREEVVKETGPFTLVNEEGRSWPATITRKQQGNHERADITGGWRPFANANGFQAGDEIRVVYQGSGVLQITKTGHTGTPRTPKASGPRKTPGKSSGRTPAARKSGGKSASKTPATSGGGVAKRRGSSSTVKRRQSAAAAAAEEVPAVHEPEGGALPQYAPPAGEYMQPIWPSWCSIM